MSHLVLYRKYRPRLFSEISGQNHIVKIITNQIRLGEVAHGYLFNKAKNRKVPIKTFLMSNPVVVGVGNIYANEALFKAGILPTALVGNLSEKRLNTLTDIIKNVLADAITQGGTTLKDFTQADGRPGYFAQKLQVYGRAGEKCFTCQETLEEIRQANRSSVFCPSCQHV